MSGDNRDGTCITAKVRYADEEQAAIALARVRQSRLERPDGKPPERIFYYCSECDGWHLSSKPPKLAPGPQPKLDGETWEEYAHRLERRIKEQRDQLESINQLRADAANRAERKRIAVLRMALGRMTERWEQEREQKYGLLEALERARNSAEECRGPSPEAAGSTPAAPFTYQGEFVLAWLLSDERVGSAGVGTNGACVVRWPDGQLRIEKGQTIARDETGRLVCL